MNECNSAPFIDSTEGCAKRHRICLPWDFSFHFPLDENNVCTLRRLKIENLRLFDTGTYTCEGYNDYGRQSTSGHLTVLPATGESSHSTHLYTGKIPNECLTAILLNLVQLNENCYSRIHADCLVRY